VNGLRIFHGLRSFSWGVKLLNWKDLSYKTLTTVFFAGLNQCGKFFFYKFLQTEISCKFLLHNYNLSFVTAVQFLLLYHDLPFLLFLFVSNVGGQTESWCKDA